MTCAVPRLALHRPPIHVLHSEGLSISERRAWEAVYGQWQDSPNLTLLQSNLELRESLERKVALGSCHSVFSLLLEAAVMVWT